MPCGMPTAIPNRAAGTAAANVGDMLLHSHYGHPRGAAFLRRRSQEGKADRAQRDVRQRKELRGALSGGQYVVAACVVVCVTSVVDDGICTIP